MNPNNNERVSVELNFTCAQLLAKLCAELGDDDPAAVISRALGLLEVAHHGGKTGRRLCLVTEDGGSTEVMF